MSQAASTVAAASSSGMARNMLPSGAVPRPRRPGRRDVMDMVQILAVRAATDGGSHALRAVRRSDVFEARN
ncbi:hypothetical protein GCM10010421_08570 [Streptomyces glaucus]|uniref:Secreted protein n=1 Tax=Streptomyces glaucus TaxID=284029 RepID=A0ABN3J885_9ACTN